MMDAHRTEPNIFAQLLRQAVREITGDKHITLSDFAGEIRVDSGDFQFWLEHEHLDRPWFRSIDREVERFAAIWQARVRKERHGNGRFCPRCKEFRPRLDFYGNGYCKPCGKEYSRSRYRANKQERKTA